MIRSTIKKLLPSRPSLRTVLDPLGTRRRAREAARGIRSDVAIPFDMFDKVRDVKELSAARRLAGIYHKGQHKIWSGKEVLPALIEKHGGVNLPDGQAEAVQALFAIILWGELAAWKVSADLALQLEPLEAKLAATSQAHDEARHFYTMYDYLSELGEVPTDLPPSTKRILEAVLEADTLTKKLVGMQMMVEPMALTLFQLVRDRNIEPVLTELLELYERDEARHVALGVLHVPKMLEKMSHAEALDLWTWEFGEYWAQLDMLQEMEPHFRALGITPEEVMRIGRQKQIRANRMMMEELGYDLRILEYFMRFFDARFAWLWPETTTRDDRMGRFREAMGVLLNWDEGDIPTELTNVAA